jgi:hypothetical protein
MRKYLFLFSFFLLVGLGLSSCVTIKSNKDLNYSSSMKEVYVVFDLAAIQTEDQPNLERYLTEGFKTQNITCVFDPHHSLSLETSEDVKQRIQTRIGAVLILKSNFVMGGGFAVGPDNRFPGRYTIYEASIQVDGGKKVIWKANIKGGTKRKAMLGLIDKLVEDKVISDIKGR